METKSGSEKKKTNSQYFIKQIKLPASDEDISQSWIIIFSAIVVPYTNRWVPGHPGIIYRLLNEHFIRLIRMNHHWDSDET